MIDEDTGAHWRPADGRRLAAVHRPRHAAVSDPTADVPTDHAVRVPAAGPASPVAVARVVPFWRDVWDRGADHWHLQAGQYTVTPDYRPIIGPTGVDGLFVNTGYSGHGIMLSVAGGRILAEALLDPNGASPLRPDRVFEPAPQPTL